MKNQILLLAFLSILIISACKKEEDPQYYNHPDAWNLSDFFDSRLDSITELQPLISSIIIWDIRMEDPISIAF